MSLKAIISISRSYWHPAPSLFPSGEWSARTEGPERTLSPWRKYRRNTITVPGVTVTSSPSEREDKKGESVGGSRRVPLIPRATPRLTPDTELQWEIKVTWPPSTRDALRGRKYLYFTEKLTADKSHALDGGQWGKKKKKNLPATPPPFRPSK